MTNAVTEDTKASTGRGSGTMKFRIPQVLLAAAVDRVLNVVPQKTTMPVLGHLLLEADGNHLKLTATDLDLTICTTLDAEVDKPGTVTLPAKRFSEIVRQLDPDTDVELDVHKANALITAGRANFRILGMGAEEFPKIPSLGFKKGVTTPAITLKKAIQRTIFCVSRDETRRALTGVLWEVQGDSMAMIGTDGHRLARISLPVDLDVDARRDVIVPTKALNQVIRLTGDAEDEGVAVKLGDDHVIFRFGKTVLFTRLIEGPFPKYQDVIPKNNDKKVIIKRGSLVDALRRVSLLSDNLTHQVRLSLKNDLIVLSARTQDIGEAQEEVEAQYGGEEMDLGYNAQYLAEILRNMDTEEVLMTLATPLAAGLVEPAEQGEDENYLCLLMPLRLVD
ncbi:MAG: DNA polymerase III subunit beta [Gemmatimonadetes bacterium]|nr:DNA polymerase III subunit beta [Gemmatimonadota bacterium]